MPMRKGLIAAVFLAGLMYAAPARAGCWATAELAPPPAGAAAGEVWAARITVLQHGLHPLPDAATATPKVTIIDRGTREKWTFTARASDPAAGVYEAKVIFPSAGTWSYEVFDGFTTWNGEPAPCAQTHSFAAVEIGEPGAGPRGGSSDRSATEASAFPLWPVIGGLGALLLAAVLAYVVRRHSRAPAAA
jgi:hypothetical protein